MARLPNSLTLHPLYLLERVWERALCRPFVAALERLGVRPNAVTAVAFALKLAAAPFMVTGRYEWAGAVWVIGAIADALDGTLARHLGAETELGAFLDATGDRVASVALLVAFALGVGTASAYQASLALVAASLLLALTRAKAESVGARGQIRTLHRSGRSIWLSGALMVGPSLAAALGRSPSEALLIAFWALTAVTGAALAVVVARTVRALS